MSLLAVAPQEVSEGSPGVGGMPVVLHTWWRGKSEG